MGLETTTLFATLSGAICRTSNIDRRAALAWCGSHLSALFLTLTGLDEDGDGTSGIAGSGAVSGICVTRDNWNTTTVMQNARDSRR